MKTPRSYVIFGNGIEEDILYFERAPHGDAIFATKSGIYRYREYDINTEDPKFVVYRISFDNRCNPVLITRIVFDDRVKYEYKYDPRESEFEVFASKDATREEILKLIASDLKIDYKKSEI